MEAEEYTKKVIDLCKKYDISPTHNNELTGHATGIGDILFRVLCIKNKIITGPFNINLTYFTSLYNNTNPIQQLEFRLELILDLVKFNDISINMFHFFFSTNKYINQYLPYNSIHDYKLYINNYDITNKAVTSDYIIFHTKCRHNSSEDYTFLKLQIKEFCKNFKSKYTIYIMGEKTFPENDETKWHGITTVYNELLELNQNNNVIDITIHDIYNNLNYSNYKGDINLIQNAKHNICFGQGGQLCTSLIFGNSTIFYYKIDNVDMNDEYLSHNNHFHCKTIGSCTEMIKNTCSV